jgi:subtilase family serine protease
MERLKMKRKNSIIMSIILLVFSISFLVESQIKADISRLSDKKKLPDLVALSMNVFPQEGGGLLPGKNTGVSCQFKNNGAVFTKEYLINIYMDGSPIVNGGKATAEMTGWGVNWIATAGRHTAKCVLDTQNVIKESNEANNEFAYAFTIPGATSKPVNPSDSVNVPPVHPKLTTDISIEKMEVKADDGGAVKPGKASRVYCYWKRTGAQPATTFRINVKMDGTSIGAGTVDQTMTSSWLAGPWIATAGKHQIYCEVDYENVVNEVNEKNNKWIQLYNLPGIIISDLGHTPVFQMGTDVMIEKIEVKAEDGGKLTDGKAARIFCYWKRTGPAPAADFRVAVFVDGHVVGLPQGSTVQHELDHGWLGTPWKADTGFHQPTIECLADSAFEIAEPNETNNKMSIRIDIPAE